MHLTATLQSESWQKEIIAQMIDQSLLPKLKLLRQEYTRNELNLDLQVSRQMILHAIDSRKMRYADEILRMSHPLVFEELVNSAVAKLNSDVNPRLGYATFEYLHKKLTDRQFAKMTAKTLSNDESWFATNFLIASSLVSVSAVRETLSRVYKLGTLSGDRAKVCDLLKENVLSQLAWKSKNGAANLGIEFCKFFMKESIAVAGDSVEELLEMTPKEIFVQTVGEYALEYKELLDRVDLDHLALRHGASKEDVCTLVTSTLKTKTPRRI